jgi:hypothetical protein
MGKGISIPVAADTKLFTSAVKAGVVTPLESVEKALDDIGRNRGGDQLEASMKDAQRATEQGADAFTDLQREASEALKKTARDASRYSKDAGNDLGRNIDRGADRAEEGLDDLNNNAKSNAIEVAASFDGSAESIADGFQGLAAEAFEGFGPAGVVAGVAAAAGIGLISQSFTNASEDAEETAQHINDLFDDMIESGNEFASESFINNGIADIVKDTERYAQVQKDAAEAGVDVSTVLRAQAGDLDAISLVQATAEATQTKLTEKQRDYTLANGESSAGIDAQIYSLDDLKARFDGVAGQTDTAAGKARDYNAAIAETGPKVDTAKDKVGELGNALSNIPNPRKVVFDIDDSAVWEKIHAIQNTDVRVQAELEFRSGGRVL